MKNYGLDGAYQSLSQLSWLKSTFSVLRSLLDPSVEGNPFTADREYEFKTEEKKSFSLRRKWALR